ncbi:MAG: helix-turn-helix transcriptional regulator, partial [Gammaproteobacteria bacterium]
MVTDQLLAALKRTLRSRGLSYKAAAESLGLSESSIKRLFADKSFTLPRLEKLCEFAGIELAELLHMAELASKQVDK